MKYCILSIFLLAILSCASENDSVKSFEISHFFTDLFSNKNLEIQQFEFNNSKAVTLITQKGNIIEIPANAFSGGTKKIKLRVREAFEMEEIYFANMQTTSNDQPLQSSGMIEIATENKSLKLLKKIKLQVLRKNYNARMSVYKGESDSIGNINWIKPSPILPQDKLSTFERGEQLFQGNCASCHNVFGLGTGPELAGIGSRRPKQWLYKYINNSARMIANGDPYATCIYEYWNKTAMTHFNLTKKEIDDLIFYLKEKGDERPDLMKQLSYPTPCDSCELYIRAMSRVTDETVKELKRIYKKRHLERKEIYANLVYPKGARTAAQTNVINQGRLSQDQVYSIELGELGWFNIDVLLKDLPEKYKFKLTFSVDRKLEKTQINLLVPAFLCNTAALKNKDGSFYFPYDLNIPPKTKCFLITVGKDKEVFFMDIQSFEAKEVQQFIISPKEIKQEAIADKISALKLNEYELDKDAKDYMKSFKEGNAGLEKVQKELDQRREDLYKLSNRKMQEARLLKPKGCNCNFLFEEVEIETGVDSADTK